MKDPNSGNLDRVQIIKGWYDKRGCGFQKIYNVAWSDGRELAENGKLPPSGFRPGMLRHSDEQARHVSAQLVSW
jgi:hypothetical protein